MKKIINKIVNEQKEYSINNSRETLQEKSQFFTPLDICKIMVSECSIYKYKDKRISILEPSAGFGILIFTLIEKIVSNNNIKEIYLVAFESDPIVYQKLYYNIKRLSNILEINYNIKLNYTLYNKNFILHYESSWTNDKATEKFDIIISNPPYKKINKSNLESKIMHKIIFGQPNIYQLFIAMSLNLLANNGVYVTLTPRNYLSGQYSKLLRKYIFKRFHLKSIYMFDNLKLFKSVDQEVLISSFKFKDGNNKLNIFNNNLLNIQTNINKLIIKNKDYSVILPKSEDDLELLNKFNQLDCTLSDLDIKLSVGPVVQFRNTNHLSKENFNNEYCPLLISRDIKINNKINYSDRIPSHKKTDNKSISVKSKKVIKNENLLLLRKITSKKDNRLIIPAILEKELFKHNYIGLDNNLLYFKKINNKSFSKSEIYGLYCYINSSKFERYYSLINGNFTINVSDFKLLSFPSIDRLTLMGEEILNDSDFTRTKCDEIFVKYIF